MATKSNEDNVSSRNINFFLKEKATPQDNIERVISSRFKDDEGNPIPFVIRAVSPAKARELEKLAQKSVKNSSNKVIGSETDYEKYSDLLLLESCVFPDFQNAELIKSYGCRNAEQLLNTMLSIGEKKLLDNAMQEVNGINQDSLPELVEEAKD